MCWRCWSASYCASGTQAIYTCEVSEFGLRGISAEVSVATVSSKCCALLLWLSAYL